MVPMRLAGRGVDVTTVDIDPASLRAATELFGFDPGKVTRVQADARTYLRSCENGYDVVIVDLFHGDGVPDYLITRDFFRDLKRCLGPDGIAVFNTFADLENPRAYAHFLTTLRRAAIRHALPAGFGLAPHINSFIVAAATACRAPPATISITCPRGICPLSLRCCATPSRSTSACSRTGAQSRTPITPLRWTSPKASC